MKNSKIYYDNKKKEIVEINKKLSNDESLQKIKKLLCFVLIPIIIL